MRKTKQKLNEFYYYYIILYYTNMDLGLKNLFLQILTNNRKEKEKDDDNKQIK
jgi:hypothetical protein